MMESSYQYSAHAHWTQHKRGILEVAEIPRTINFAAPPEFGGEPGLWTPEHMLIGAVATCYLSTFRAMAEYSKLAFHGMDVVVQGTIEKQEGGFRFTNIVLRPSVTIDKPEDRERTQRLIEKAERACLISRSLNCNIALESTIRVEEAVAAAK
jgi:peroxiredoxin-like protein